MFSDFYDVNARVFRAGEPFEIELKGRSFQTALEQFAENEVLYLVLFAGNGIYPDGKLIRRKVIYRKYPIVFDNASAYGKCVIDAMDEGEYHCCIGTVKEDGIDSAISKLVCEFDIYILEDDLYKLTPFKGDMHVHSSYSHCSNKENFPRYIAACARRNGLDYICMTDHRQMTSSETLTEFGAEFNSGFKVFKGEECHLPCKHDDTLFRNGLFFGHVHIVNFGGSECVSAYANNHYEEFCAELTARAEKIDLPYSFEVRYLMAGADWICEKIHEYGGLAFFCHPCWMSDHMFNMPIPIRDYILEQGKFDAVEIIGMAAAENSLKSYSYSEANDLGAAFYQDAVIRCGKLLPVVGNSDSHNDADLTLGTKFTVVFAENTSLEALQEAIKKGNCAAVTTFDSPGIAPHVSGSFRLVRYVHFLLRNFYPEHDELCKAEGILMLNSMRTNKTVKFENDNAADYIRRFFNK